MTTAPACFKAYDIRGRVPDDLDETLAYRIGRAYASWLDGDDVVVGRDVRRSSPDIARAVVAGLLEGGMNVHDIGLCGTEEVNFATAHWEMDGGIVITASHNPADHNGMKLVAAGARPIARESGLAEIGRIAADGSWRASTRLGTKQELDHRPAYIARLLQLVDVAALPPLRVVVNPGNGCAGPVVDALEAHLPFELVRIQHSP
ncbi:MAG: phosphomannomutase, partial [Ectothiorhodospiraceae bacterium]